MKLCECGCGKAAGKMAKSRFARGHRPSMPKSEREQRRREYRARHRIRLNELSRIYAANNKEALRESRQRFVERNREIVSERWRRDDLKRNYGMTIEEWDALYEEQGGKCAICHIPACPSGRRFAVDHDHESGVIRGLLCVRCNAAIGHIENTKQDLDDWVESARSYLRGDN